MAMNKHLQQRVEGLFNRYQTATLATCGAAGPQISVVTYAIAQVHLHLFLSHGSDHRFNLETQPELVLLSPTWKLYGQGVITQAVIAPHSWQMAIHVTPNRLHILSEDGQHSVETIDF